MLRLRRGPGSLYRRVRSVGYLLGRDRRAVLAFLAARYPIALPLADRVRLLARFVAITNHVRTYHTQAELLAVADRILRRAGRGPLTVVEAGCGKGASTAKLSLVVRRAGGRLVACDSFRGIPENTERHRHLDGRRVRFRAGAFTGRRREVERTLARFGAPEVVELRKGWFADTLPGVAGPLDVVLLDVDLLASTRTCVVELFPRLRPGGVLFSQDGHLEATVALLRDARFWRDEVGVAPPVIPGLGRAKLLEIVRLPLAPTPPAC
ncbi:MAG: TylF/MycF/NovP-related O-methyltransferase [Candidatus Binatia bacterium]